MRTQRHLIFLLVGAALLFTGARAEDTLYPPIEPYASGMFQVSERHTIHWMTSGNPDGIPAILLHGGPGGRSSGSFRRLPDPELYHIIQFDQRGSGKSEPYAEWRDNTTAVLASDIHALRIHLGIDRPAVLVGISWGTTLALAYAQVHPADVAGLALMGVFTARAHEIEHLYHGTRPFYPDNHEQLRSVLPRPDDRDYARQIFDLATGPDSARAEAAIVAFATYEAWMEHTEATLASATEEAHDGTARSLTVLENHYMMNACFIREGELFERLPTIEHLPAYIANGRLDMLTPCATAIEVAARLPRSQIEIVEGAGHAELAVALALVRGLRWLSTEISK